MSKIRTKIKTSSWHPTTNNQSNKSTIQKRPFPVENQNQQNPETSQQFFEFPRFKPGEMIENINRSIENGYTPREFKMNSSPLQGKLTIGQPGDKYEQEADEVAAQVVQRINEPQTPPTNKSTIQTRPFPVENQNQQNPEISQQFFEFPRFKPGEMIENINRSIENGYTPREFKMNSNPLQGKLTIGEPGDKYEQEADEVAAQVVQRINEPETPPSNKSTIQTKPFSVENQNQQNPETNQQFFEFPRFKPGEMIENINRSIENGYTPRESPLYSIQKKSTTPIVGGVQRESVAEMRRKESQTSLQGSSELSGGIQRQMIEGSKPNVQADFETSLNQAKGGGSSLDKAFREKVEPEMGADFSDVKVHSGSEADKLSKEIQAKAFTTGQDIFFRQGEYEPGSRGGQELLAHELTHVIQQNQGVRAKTVQRQSQASEAKSKTPSPQKTPASNNQSRNLKGFSLTGELGHEDNIIIVIIVGGVLISVKLSEWLLKGLGIILERLFSPSLVSAEQEQRALENAISIPLPNCEEITSQIAEAGSIAIELIPTNGDVAGFISNVSAEVLDQIADTLSCSGKFDVTYEENSNIMRIESGNTGSSRNRLTKVQLDQARSSLNQALNNFQPNNEITREVVDQTLEAIFQSGTRREKVALSKLIDELLSGANSAAISNFLARVTRIRNLDGVVNGQFDELYDAFHRGDAILAHGPLQTPIFPAKRHILDGSRYSMVDNPNGNPSRQITTTWDATVDFVIVYDGGNKRLILGGNHSGLSGGRAYVYGAGELIINKKGKVMVMTNISGHYQPTEANAKRAYNLLVEKGFIDTDVQLRIVQFEL